jgi:chorismate mutase
MWCWRRMEKISWTDHVRNEEVLLRVKEQRNCLHKISKRKANLIVHISRRNCLLQRVIEGKIKGGMQVTGRRGRRRRKLLDGLRERRGYSHLNEEAVDRTMRRVRFGRGFGPVVRQTTK